MTEGRPPAKRERSSEPSFPPFNDDVYVFDPEASPDLGQGRSSRVKRATQVASGKQVAVKCFKPDPGETRRNYVEHALAELGVLRKLGAHPGIVTLVEPHLLASAHGDLHMVMELAIWDWSTFVASAHIHIVPLGQLKGYIAQACRALAYCHERRVVHRDVKPENILITSENVVKLADFGLASTRMWHYSRHTREVTTRWQRAPEVFVCQGHYDEKVDVWSMAMTIIQLLTRKALLRGANDADQLRLIYLTCGTPKVHEWPTKLATLLRKSYEMELRYDLPARLMRHAEDCGRKRFMAPDARSFLEPMLALNPEHRAIMSQVLKHEYLLTKEPLPYASAQMIAYRK